MTGKLPGKNTTTIQKAGLAAFGLVLSVLLLEALLRLTGMAILGGQAFRNARGAGRPGVHRIMCVGESTTQNQYPRLLEDILNERGGGAAYRVIDTGRAGVNSSFLLQKLEADLDEYAPEQVVVMMGVNDRNPLLGGERLPYRNFRVYRLIRILYANFKARPEAGPAQGLPGPERTNTAGGTGFATEAEYRKAIGLHPDDAVAYIRLAEYYSSRGRFSDAENIYRELIGLQPNCIQAYCGLCYVLLSQDKPAEAEKALAIGLVKNPYDSEELYRSLAQICGILKKPRLSREYLERAEKNLPSWYINTTENYRKLHAILRKRGIKLMAVQYPMRSLDSLKRTLGDGVVFVDNEQSFKKAVAGSSYKKYFLDLFAGDFGHCTALGNRLLAENIAASILAQPRKF